MGQRANLVVKEGGARALYYTHWRANLLDRDLFWGPGHARRFMRAQRSEAEGAEWLDEVWAEGGALLDVDARRLLWWGGEDVLDDIPRRRVHLALMQVLWEGWQIEWAAGGICDLARAAGIPESRVLVRDERGVVSISLGDPEDRSWVSTALSVVRDGEVRLFPVIFDIEDVIRDLDALAGLVTAGGGHATLDMGAYGNTFPTAGVHMDIAGKSVSFWNGAVRPALAERTAATNPDWTVIWEGDRYESQLAAAPALRFPRIDEDAIIAELEAELLAEDMDFTGYAADLAKRAFPGKDVEINPVALRDDPQVMTMAERRRLWDRAVSAWRTSRSTRRSHD